MVSFVQSSLAAQGARPEGGSNEDNLFGQPEGDSRVRRKRERAREVAREMAEVEEVEDEGDGMSSPLVPPPSVSVSKDLDESL